MTIRRGDVFCHELAGGGGWGDPLERDPNLVLSDVRNELVSEDAALNTYGVVIDTGSWTVDETASEARRTELRSCRSKTAEPVSWHDVATDGAET